MELPPVAPDDGIRITGAFLSGIAGLLSGAVSAVATRFDWGGGPRAQLESLNKRQGEIEANIRLILQVLLKERRPGGED